LFIRGKQVRASGQQTVRMEHFAVPGLGYDSLNVDCQSLDYRRRLTSPVGKPYLRDYKPGIAFAKHLV
jgi:hypothetical protein